MPSAKFYFRVFHRVRGAGGLSAPKSDCYVTKNPSMAAFLRNCLASTAVELTEEQAAAAEKDEEFTSAPRPQEPSTEHSDEATEEAQPEWEFTTIPKMRSWLDKSGVVLPGTGTRKAKYESLCADAWAEGLRPDVLYGLPGGREPSPGQSAPDPTIESLAHAIASLQAEGKEVPEEVIVLHEILVEDQEVVVDGPDQVIDFDTETGKLSKSTLPEGEDEALAEGDNQPMVEGEAAKLDVETGELSKSEPKE